MTGLFKQRRKKMSIETFAKKSLGFSDQAWKVFQGDHLFPSRKDEAYRYTNLENFTQSDYSSPQENIETQNLLKEWSEIGGVTLFRGHQLSESTLKWETGQPLSSGADYLDNLRQQTPLQKSFTYTPSKASEVLTIIYAAGETDGISGVDISIEVKDNCQFTLNEIFLSEDKQASYRNQKCHITCLQGSQVEHNRIHLPNDEEFHFGFLDVSCSRDATYRNNLFHLGGILGRQNFDFHLRQKGSRIETFGYYGAHGNRQLDHYTQITHHEGHTESEQIYKGIINDQARAVFMGKIIIKPGASGSDSKQLNKNLLLSKKAKVYTHPTLLIDNDDVKAAHGATIGQLDPAALFYLKSRGISESRAQLMLSQAFAYDIVEKIQNPIVKEKVHQWILHHLKEIL